MDVGAIQDNVMTSSSVERDLVLPEEKKDREGDRRIEECLSASTFTNRVVDYSYDFRSWPIRVIFNPEMRPISVEGTNKLVFVRYAVVSKDSLPKELEAHFNSIVKKKLGSDYCGRIGNATSTMIEENTKLDFDWFENLKQVEKYPGFAFSSPALTFSDATDQQIRDIFQSKVLVNQAVEYPYNGETYPVRIINNPQKEPLHAKGFNSIQRWSFALISAEPLPLLLAGQIGNLAPTKGKDIQDYVMKLYSLLPFRKNLCENYSELKPVVVNVDGQLNAQFDAQIKDIFTSKEFVNKVLYCRIKGEDYMVRLIHNPEKQKLTASRILSSSLYGDQNVTESWNSRYGIVTDKQAPKELIDRIAKIANPSFWDWRFSFQIIEGFVSNGFLRFYQTSWFDFYGDLKK